MVDKLKEYFHKKKKNVKFMNAGKGCRLSDSTSSYGQTQRVREPIVRVEPTQEARTAGEAALARLEAKKTDSSKFNTSYKAIQARVRRELEQERNSGQETQKKEQGVVTKEKKKDTLVLAVADVYFSCPYLSEKILTEEEWKQEIREFLYEQLEGDDIGLTACLIIRNCNKNKQKVDNCVDTLGKYLENIINNPDVEKYRKIRMSNKIFQEKVLPVEGALQFLKAAGFREQELMHNDAPEKFLVWEPDSCSIEDVTMLAEALKSAEVIPLELDRNLQVLSPLQAATRNELPDSFFTLTLEELKRRQQYYTEIGERNRMLRTEAMREKDKERDHQVYRYAIIRIKFPDNIILQGTFGVHEKFQAVVDFVTENLADSSKPFQLTQLPSLKFTKDHFDKSLHELKLIPASVLLFFWSNREETNESTGYLKEEILSYIQPA